MRTPLVVAVTIFLPFAWQQADAQSKTTRPPDRRERERQEEREREGKRSVMSARSGPDEPEEMEDLTRELWKFARGKGYDRAVRRANASAAKFAAQAPQMRLPTGWVLAPAGAQVELGRMPYEAVSFAGRVVVLNNGYYLQGLEDPEISIVDAARPSVTRTLRVASLYPSATASPNGNLYVSGGSSDSVFQIDRQFQVTRSFDVGEYAGPVAAIDAEHVAVALLTAPDSVGASGPGKVAILNVTTGRIESTVNAGYFPSAMRLVGKTLYLSLVGEHKLLAYDLSGGQLRLRRTIATGRAPQSLCADDARVYVVNSGSDDVSAVSLTADSVVATYRVRFPGPQGASARFGGAPTSCAVSNGKLYVSAAGLNAVAVFDLGAASNATSAEPVGFFPTAWYPTKVLADSGRIVVLSAKGIRARRPNPQGPQAIADTRTSGPDYVLTLLRGSVAVLPESVIPSRLAGWTTQVAQGTPLYSAGEGLRLPIRHVFYIVRENRSWDQVMGDLGRGEGDSSLTLFGERITPVAHQIAREFVALDHFYADGEISVLGHSFTTSGYASPFLEWLGNTTYAARYRGYPFGTVPGAYSPTYLWDALEAKNVSYRIYGEPYYLFTRMYRLITERFGADHALAKRFYAHSMALADSVDRGTRFTALSTRFMGRGTNRADALKLLADARFSAGLSTMFTGDNSLARAISSDATFKTGVADFLTHYTLGYPTWNLAFSDLDRTAIWRRDFETAIKENRVPAFSYLWLPNDHTAGVSPDFLNPYQLVAQNDAALGQIVQTISNSPIWNESLIIVMEDDAQNGPDHVDATREVALLIGPSVKRGVVVSDRFDQLSALRTVELILGLDPMNLGDAVAAPMFNAFTTTPDARPFTPVAPSSYLVREDKAKFDSLAARRR
ncbi:MAG TPA: alkaline phosphatase family protein [Gemmatimonadaceae bacterium]|nr:alkaline phosphatase family protein [Gemmatimonadaceae bacterium]